MLEFIKKLFTARTVPCPSCSIREPLIHAARGEVDAMERTIQILRDEIQYLRSERAELQELFNRSVRLEASPARETVTPGPVHVGGLNSWNRAKSILENQHKRHVTPEDEKAAYWKNKNEALAQEAGLGPTQENPNAS